MAVGCRHAYHYGNGNMAASYINSIQTKYNIHSLDVVTSIAVMIRIIKAIFFFVFLTGRHCLLQTDSIACIEQLTNHKIARHHVPDDGNTNHHLSWNVTYRTVLYSTMRIMEKLQGINNHKICLKISTYNTNKLTFYAYKCSLTSSINVSTTFTPSSERFITGSKAY
jgi:hypothetical protein